MKKKSFILLMLLFFSFLSIYASAYVHLFHNRTGPAAEQGMHATALQLPPVLMKIFAGEFKGLVADYLLLEAAAFLGGDTKATEEDWEAIGLLFKQTMALDPHFKQSYYMLQSVLPWQAGKCDLAIELLEKSKKHRPWDWLPGFFIGFDYFYFLNDNLKASEYLMEASEIEGSPIILATMGARLAQKAGSTRNAIVFLKAMHKKTDDEEIREILKERINVLEGVFILERGVARFRSRFGHSPNTLDELLSKGILKKIPHNPYTGYYTYENGQIGF